MHFAQGLFAFIDHYGYFAVFIGGIFEGEVILLLGGLLGHQTDLSFPLILTFAFLGAISNDIVWFLVGKYGGVRVLARFPLVARWMKRPLGMIQRKPRTLSLFMRFMYGFRNIVPFSIGMSGVSEKVFMLWNAVGAVLWTAVFGGAGFLLGAALESFFGKIRHFDLFLIIVVILVFAIFHTISSIVKSKLKKVAVEGELTNETL